LDVVLLTAAPVNDDLVVVDDLGGDELAGRVPMPVRLSYDFADVLSELRSRNAEVGTDEHGSAFRVPRSAFGAGQGLRAVLPPLPSSDGRASARGRGYIGCLVAGRVVL